MTYLRRERLVYLMVAIMLMVSCVGINLYHDIKVEESARKQARQNLQQIKYCYIETLEQLGAENAMSICTAKVKIGFTGDVYILDANTLEFVLDNSSDVPSHLFFTKESVGKFFHSWESATKALNVIQLGKNSDSTVNAFYRFNKGIEWLEWVYLPDDVKNSNGLKLIVVHGVQANEAYNEFNSVKYLMFILTSIAVFLLLVMHKMQGLICPLVRRTDDEQCTRTD